MQKSEIT